MGAVKQQEAFRGVELASAMVLMAASMGVLALSMVTGPWNQLG
jgi:hypothetical protein